MRLFYKLFSFGPAWVVLSMLMVFIAALVLPGQTALPTNKASLLLVAPNDTAPLPRANPLPRAIELPAPPAVASLSPAPAPEKPTKTSRRVTIEDVNRLIALAPLLPLPGLKASDLKESFRAPRSGGRTHHAIDIMAPKGTPIYAITDGTIVHLFNDDLGGICIYQTDAEGRFMFFYAHLSRYAKGLHADQAVKKGDIIGYVGATGNARGGPPHLHFGIAKRIAGAWWSQSLLNPYYIFTGQPYPLPKSRR